MRNVITHYYLYCSDPGKFDLELDLRPPLGNLPEQGLL